MKNKSLYILLLVMGLLMSYCTSNTILKKPDDLLSKSQMVDVITDMFLASGAQNIKNLDLKRNVNYFPLVFEKYRIDSAQFKSSNAYYISTIDDYNEIMEQVDKRLKAYKKEIQDQVKKMDSLKEAEENLINPELQ